MQNITKQELRQKIKIELSQNKQNFEKWSKLICQNIINSEFYQKAQIVYAYMALPDEVDLSILIDDALCKNKTVYVPKVVPNSNKMIFFDYSKCQFENGSFGILENIFTTYGVDSYISRCACVIMGCSETIFYVTTVYISQTKVKKLFYAVPVALVCSFVGTIFACFLCRFM